ncbi:hypothetical protein RFM41_12145 [Mesorhizobium sp. VK25A]|uniref:Uncharacterized protein n=1 Tax=Mesorhizobium vachelliae TaxID=3072309 RepID=A0ABU5A0N4_9HYPH|nr:MULTISPECIES: hypothetical protein [unclassified Mesorhizobium]MDX8530094.1 hypothetical protein [Mesorhizobium sp. VK25D]MDX8544492.1 hypothetical protein [Mesorhizobium sp. VK25A]
MAKHTSTNDLAGATPVPVPDSVPVVARIKGSARARKTADVGPDYAALGVPDTHVEEMERLRRAFVDLGRRSTGQVFDCGAVIHEVRELAPDQEAFAKWSKAIFGLSRRGAENYAAVHRTLVPYRDRMVTLGLVASALYHLASASGEQVEEVLAVRESGRELTAGQIKAMLGKGGAPTGSADDGGPEGLKITVTEKTAFASRLLFDTLYQMLRDVHVALEPHHAGGQVVKSKAEASLVHPARLAGGLIESLVYAAQVPAGQTRAGIVHVLPLAESRWSRLRRVLYAMGSGESWPKVEKTGAWLADTVLPELEWGLGRAGAEKARAVLDERVAAAEAERARATKEKERAKFETKKARMQAKREALKRGMGGRNAAGVPSGTVAAGPAKAPVSDPGDLAATGLTAASGQA